MSQEVTYYDADGAESIESPRCVAKLVKIGSEFRYFIKYFEFGPQRGLPINPHDSNFHPKLLDRDPVTGDFITKYKSCTKEALDIYLRFLSTKNDLFYRRVLAC